MTQAVSVTLSNQLAQLSSEGLQRLTGDSREVRLFITQVVHPFCGLYPRQCVREIQGDQRTLWKIETGKQCGPSLNVREPHRVCQDRSVSCSNKCCHSGRSSHLTYAQEACLQHFNTLTLQQHPLRSACRWTRISAHGPDYPGARLKGVTVTLGPQS
jgi:hypothetical protein